MSAETIRQLNDHLRRTFLGGKVMMTSGVAAMPPPEQAALVAAVQSFDRFDSDNDPHREHDFGSIEIVGESYFWKIDYYDPAMEFGSDDPADPAKTTRVLLIMRAAEY